MQTVPLEVSDSIQFNGSGNGTLKMVPDGKEVWHPQTVSVKASSSTSEANCKIYAGHSAQDATFVDATLSGSSGDSTDRLASYNIARTQTPAVIAVWSGGDASASGTMVIRGTKDIP